jgi:hypothetical protein
MISGNHTLATVEMFCSPPEVVKTVFQRFLGALQASVETLKGKMKE